MYSLFHVVADNVLPEGEGDGTMEAVKSCVSGAATGALYKSGEKCSFYQPPCGMDGLRMGHVLLVVGGDSRFKTSYKTSFKTSFLTSNFT